MSSAAEVRARFDRATAGSVGVEEELMLLRPGDLELVPASRRALELLDGDPRFKPELPATQIEAMTPPCETIGELAAALAAGRRDLVSGLSGELELAAAGVHPTAAIESEISAGERYQAPARRYGERVLRRQVVFALQIHVAPGSADSALAAYNALRSYLPDVAALAANAPYFGGEDTGLASVRPQIGQLLPRQGVPPALSSWEEYAAAIDWALAGPLITSRGNWWWELRPHPDFGTLELRVPDAQTTIADAVAIAALAQCLVIWLVERHESGEALPVHPAWRIAENRWLAARDGVAGELADLDTGVLRPVGDRIEALVSDLEPVAERLGCASELGDVRRLATRNGAARQREVVAEAGLAALPGWLRNRFLEGIAPQPGSGASVP